MTAAAAPAAGPPVTPRRAAWLGTIAVAAAAMLLRDAWPWVAEFPEGWTIPVQAWIDFATAWMVEHFRWLFRGASWILGVPLAGVQQLFETLPWATTVALVTLIAWQSGGWRTAAFAFGALAYVVVVGYWDQGMNTLALVAVAIPLSVGLGFAIGVWGHRSKRAETVILPTLDLMQTVPAFAYLIPILLLFGFGPVVGLIASVVFAAPPMVRNTMLGYRRIPANVLEAGAMSGCTPRQRFWWVETPSALPQMLLGVNQTTMAALAMVIIASIIGGFDDIGWEVLSTMRKAQFGQSLLSGFVIALLAMLLDRVTANFARRRGARRSHRRLSARRFGLVCAAAALATLAASAVAPPLRSWPDAWTIYPADAMNQGILYVTVEFGDAMEALKHAVQFYVLLPVKLGFSRAIAPFTWGFRFTPEMGVAWWAAIAAICGAALWRGRGGTAVAALGVGGVLYFGVTGLAWPSVLVFVAMLAFQLGGVRLAAFAAGSTLFLLLTGVWEPAMLSIYLCGTAVGICILAGGLVGVWAASSDRVSGFIRPINDTLQTMPQFVLLIPALMLFRVGEFTALLAIIAYAIVPMIRYTEQGLRSVPRTLIEAGVCSGCTPWQMFWQVRAPHALPQILLGVNQTVLYALGMLVIAALVGTTGLGQQIYLALSRAHAGEGIVAGLGMALIAMVTDRMLRAVIARRR